MKYFIRTNKRTDEMGKFINIQGQVFGRLTVINRVEAKNESRWFCACQCGGQTITTGSKLRSGYSNSCGCLRKDVSAQITRKHGMANKSKTYRTWKEMRQRCSNPNADQYKWYGGRGVKVCERWRDFVNFLADMGERPEGKTIDRIDCNKDYEPSNCRWATPKEQAETNRGVFKKGHKPWNKGKPNG